MTQLFREVMASSLLSSLILCVQVLLLPSLLVFLTMFAFIPGAVYKLSSAKPFHLVFFPLSSVLQATRLSVNSPAVLLVESPVTVISISIRVRKGSYSVELIVFEVPFIS